MTLSPGARLGPYEILSPIGAGGMGEVYRARDTRLGREVAIKVLPEEFSSDRERLSRFEQEARSASALNHPNIITIHDIGQQDSTAYIAMELVEGRTLRELAASGPLPIRKILNIATQVAEGLAKAHSAGIVHRDLKPENVMVTKDGFVKILDFGLAKLVLPESGEVSAMPTLAKPETHPGIILGTVAYMSPEQAGGEPVDFGSDQFSLGSILYEATTGQKAFQRKTAAETLSAIIREEPEPLAKVRSEVPLPLRWIVERCLAKDPEERYASTRDLARDLGSVRDHISEVSSAGEALLASQARRRRRLFPLLAGLGLLSVGVLAGGLTARRLWRETSAPVFHRLSFRKGIIHSARLAADGQTIVYAASWDGEPVELFSTRPGSAESRPLGLPPAMIASISSSGEMALLLNPRFVFTYLQIGTLARAPLAGGAPREMLTDVHEADWAPDGRQLAVVRIAGDRDRLEFPPGKVLYETEMGISHVRFSPKGDWIAFFERRGAGKEASVIAIDRAGKKKTLSSGWLVHSGGLAWSPTGEEVWFTATRSGFPLSLHAVTLSGRERLVANLPGGLRLQDISRGGDVLATHVDDRLGIMCQLPGEARERELSWLNASFLGDLSPDGRLFVFHEDVGASIYLRKTDGSPAVRLGEGYLFTPMMISPDGQWVLATPSRSSTELNLLPTGAGELRHLQYAGLEDFTWVGWFPDGRRIAFRARVPGREGRIYVQDLSSKKVRPVTAEGIGSGFAAAISPDGKWVAAIDTGDRITIYPVEGGDPRALPGPLSNDQLICWSEDGRFLYVYTIGDVPEKVYRVDASTGARTLWKEMMPSDPAGIWRIHPIRVAPDGRSYAYTYIRWLTDLYLVDGLK